MRNKLMVFFLPLVFTAHAFSAPVSSACDWVDKEALAALGLDNAVPTVEPQGTYTPKLDQCTFAAPDTQKPSLMVTVQPSLDDLEVKPVCNWRSVPAARAEMGNCYMDVGHTSLAFTLLVEPSSASEMNTTFSDQVERLFNKHVADSK